MDLAGAAVTESVFKPRTRPLAHSCGTSGALRNLIFISHRIPFPLTKGEKIRAYNLLRHLSQFYRVYLGCVVDDPEDFTHVPHLREICADVGAFGISKRIQKLKALACVRPGKPLMPDYYFNPALARWVRATMAHTEMDIVYVFCGAMMPYAAGLPRRGLILDMQDIDSEKWALYAGKSGWPMRAVWAREARTLLAFERQAALAADATLFVTEAEARRFTELAPEVADRVDWVEMGVDLEEFSPTHDLPNPYSTEGPHLVFTGNMDYWPNADAACWFAAEVLPLLRRRAVAPEFHIVGANPGPEVRRLTALPGVEVTGRVPDIRPYVAHANVSVSPLRMARGVQNKVLHAMAMGRPVVASSQAFEGIRAVAGRDLLVADGAEATARKVAAVLDGECPGLGAAGRAAMERGYAWEATLARLNSVMERSLRGRLSA